MYKITYKGKDQEPTFIDDEKGQKVLDIFLSNKNTRIVTGNIAFNTGDIKTITKVEQTAAEVAPKIQSNIEKDYLEFRRKMLAISTEKRATFMRIPKMLWSVMTKAEMSDETKEKIIARQKTYLEENPKCMYANPKVYRDLIPNYASLSEIDTFKPIQNVMTVMTLKMVESLIQTDLTYSKR